VSTANLDRASDQHHQLLLVDSSSTVLRQPLRRGGLSQQSALRIYRRSRFWPLCPSIWRSLYLLRPGILLSSSIISATLPSSILYLSSLDVNSFVLGDRPFSLRKGCLSHDNSGAQPSCRREHKRSRYSRYRRRTPQKHLVPPVRLRCNLRSFRNVLVRVELSSSN
jgi:hypothetical protein